MMTPFVIKEKVQPSFVETILKREPKFNAIIDINNLLASKPVREVTIEEIQNISKSYNLDIKTSYRECLQNFYSHYLKYCFQDHKLTEHEIDDLLHLKRLLFLTDEETSKINAKVGTSIFEEETQKAIQDGRLSEEEKIFLEQLKTTLALHESIANKIYEQAAQDYFSDFFNSITSDNRISEEEEKELHEIAKSLGVNVEMDDAAKTTYDRMKLLWLIENGKIPSITVNLPLVNPEVCYFKTYVNWMGCVKKAKTADEGPKLSKKSSIASIKPENDLNTLDKGTLYLTNKRLIFTGQKITKSIYFNKLEESIVFLNGVEVYYEDSKVNFILFSENIDVFSAILSKVN
jgi:hypothetical protein